MRYLFVHLFLLVLVVTHPILGVSIDHIISKADHAFQSRDVSGNLIISITLLENALTDDSLSLSDMNNYHIYWRLARNYSDVNNYTSIPKKEWLSLYQKGEAYGKHAIKINPNGVQAHYWYGICLGRYAETRGILETLFAIGPIESSMKRIIEIDSTFPRSYFILARVYRKAPGFISIGDINKAKLFIQKALDRDPFNSYFYLEQAEIAIAMKEWSTAKAALQILASLQPLPDDFKPTLYKNQKEGRALSSRLPTP